MSKRRRASELMFSKSHGLRYPVKIVVEASGTGTGTQMGTFTLIASATAAVATSVYLTVETATNKAVLVGTAGEEEIVV